MLTSFLFVLKSKPAEPLVRFETEHCEQMQVDLMVILKNSFVAPLAASLKQANLLLDVEVANSKVGPWLMDITV
ncbi:hypothetical protein QN375_24795 [Pseudomonas sp. MH9.2]|uniref:hypothetical protein n=1 Tax=unclassified Pseudomonas TaxID=196821 RepID=UPI002AC917BC|nr:MULTISPECIES: hypothetical protein [unclassified Pseudomonas]MEB0028946.1 hypothetical protein [Pseudomonas sp. MH9.2]MEB0120922.1 hypothetical protein [Pseudomonas sp. CCI1.2]WPX67790.1 hypothetical protein RHM55_18790 [Pseudomonas sp. MH9.2]